MDRETKGLISEMLTNAYEKQNVIETILWALEADENIESEEDFALGYMIGALNNIANRIIANKKEQDWRYKLMKKILNKEYEKTQTQIEKANEERRTKRVITKRFDTTDREVSIIRNMIIPMMAPFRTKITHEIALWQSK